jgi:hypothetical protein
MHQQTLLFFQYQRQIFGICTCCGEFFRLSDCKVYQEAKAPTDWLDKRKPPTNTIFLASY